MIMYVLTVPGKPIVSTATTTMTSITPFWTVTQGSVVRNYEVVWKRNTSIGCSNTHQGSHTTSDNSTLTYTIIGLEEASRYTITVRAMNAAGSSDVSDPVTGDRITDRMQVRNRVVVFISRSLPHL